MFARVARFEGINVEAASARMDQAEAIIRPLVEGLAGYAGHLQLVSDAGEQISITLFDSADNAAAAEPVFDVEMPKKLGEMFTGEWEGRRVAVGGFNVVSDERR